MDDPEFPVPTWRDGVGEVRAVVSVRNHDDGHTSELRERSHEPAGRFRRAHHDCRGRLQERAHALHLQPAVKSRRVDHHFVERPWVAQVGDPGLSEVAGQRGARLARRRTAASRRRSGRRPSPLRAQRGSSLSSTNGSRARRRQASAPSTPANPRSLPARRRPGRARSRCGEGSGRRARRPPEPTGPASHLRLLSPRTRSRARRVRAPSSAVAARPSRRSEGSGTSGTAVVCRHDRRPPCRDLRLGRARRWSRLCRTGLSFSRPSG